LRGSGRFAVATRRGSATPHAGAAALRPDHYPLHCGAVVASRWRRGVAAPRPTRAQPRCAPIIPFIAGQWSLLAALAVWRAWRSARLNPLHCGAVVASRRARPASAGTSRLNPLHCGAVVASRCSPYGGGRTPSCLNPLHCGAVVASETSTNHGTSVRCRLNPLHCGAVVASARTPPGAAQRVAVLIPFIAGQWSLPSPPRHTAGGVPKS